MPPIHISSKYTFGDILSTPYINLPLKKVNPFPFRRAVDNIAYSNDDGDDEEEFDAMEHLKQPYHLITLKTSQKYFVPESTYSHNSYE